MQYRKKIGERLYPENPGNHSDLVVQVAKLEDFDPDGDGKQSAPSDKEGPPQGVELVLGYAREHAPEGDQNEREAEGVHQGNADRRLIS